MTGTGHLLIADFRKSATASDVQDLVAKLHRRGFWTTLLDPGSPLPRDAAGLAVILDGVAIRSQALRTILGQAESAGIPVVAWLDGAEPSKFSGQLPSNVSLVHGRDGSRDRVLSRFANTIAGARVGSTEIETLTGGGRGSPEPVQTAPGGAVWSWPGAMLGPLWPVAAGRPLAGFLGLALLMAGTVAAASLARSPLAPLVGFAGAWLAFAVLMGLFGGERAAGADEERWFRPVGALALAVVVGFVALVGWSKAQSEQAALQSQLTGAAGNPVVVGRRASGWSWYNVLSPVDRLPFTIPGEAGPGSGGELSPIDPGTPSPPIVPPTPPLSDDGGSCDKLEGTIKDIFCGDQGGKPPA